MIRKLGLFLVMVGALALSFSGQMEAVKPLLGKPLAIVFASTTDLATLLALNEVTTSRRAKVRGWGWAVLLLAGGTALGLNTWHALGTDKLPAPAAVAVGAGPVVLAWLLSHLVALVLTEKREAAAQTASQQASTPAPATAPTTSEKAAKPVAEPVREAPPETAGSAPNAASGPAQPVLAAVPDQQPDQTGTEEIPVEPEALPTASEQAAESLPVELIDRAEKAERQALQRSGGKRGLPYREAPRRLGVRYDTARAALDAARARMTAQTTRLDQFAA